MKLTTASSSLLLLLLSSLPSITISQNVTVPDTCTEGFSPGTDTVIYTIPYTYAQTLSIIGSYRDLTWSGNPPDTVTLNGSDNTVGTARSYMTAGASVIETLLIYDSPRNGPYYEVHNLALLNVPMFQNVSFYAQYDGTTVTSTCDGRASVFNFTAVFCASDPAVAQQVLHLVHSADAQGAAKLLGGQNFTSCEALGGGATGTGTAPPVATFTGEAMGLFGRVDVRWATSVVVGAAALALL